MSHSDLAIEQQAEENMPKIGERVEASFTFKVESISTTNKGTVVSGWVNDSYVMIPLSAIVQKENS